MNRRSKHALVILSANLIFDTGKIYQHFAMCKEMQKKIAHANSKNILNFSTHLKLDLLK